MEGVRLIAVFVTAEELAELEEITSDLRLENLGHALRTCLNYVSRTTKPDEVKLKIREGMGPKRAKVRTQLDLWRRRQNG